MNGIDILQAMNIIEQQPLHWTKKEQNNAIDLAVGSIEKVNKIKELEGYYFIENGKIHPCIIAEDADYDESVDALNQ